MPPNNDELMPELSNCPFCDCAMFMEIDCDGGDFEMGIEEWATATISGEHERELFDCPLSRTEDNGVTFDLAPFTNIQQVADIWNRRPYRAPIPAPTPSATHEPQLYLHANYTCHTPNAEAVRVAVEALGMIFAYGENNDSTAYPWWGITRESKIGVIGEVLLAGPFFSREQAERQLEGRRYHYGSKARTYCFSAHDSMPFRNLMDKATTALSALRALPADQPDEDAAKALDADVAEALELLRKLKNVAANFAPANLYDFIIESEETISAALQQRVREG